MLNDQTPAPRQESSSTQNGTMTRIRSNPDSSCSLRKVHGSIDKPHSSRFSRRNSAIVRGEVHDLGMRHRTNRLLLHAAMIGRSFQQALTEFCQPAPRTYVPQFLQGAKPSQSGPNRLPTSAVPNLRAADCRGARPGPGGALSQAPLRLWRQRWPEGSNYSPLGLRVGPGGQTCLGSTSATADLRGMDLARFCFRCSACHLSGGRFCAEPILEDISFWWAENLRGASFWPEPLNGTLPLPGHRARGFDFPRG